MMERRTVHAAGWSISIYQVILHAYPYSFRRDFGDSMRQVFIDSVREATRRAGLSGLVALWVRTAGDVARSLVSAYLTESRDAMFKVTISLILVYLCALLAVVGYGAVRFQEFYHPPAFSTFGAPGAHEDALIASYEQAMNGTFGSYRRFVITAGLSLAALLGMASALLGLWQKSAVHGGAALLVGIPLTILAFAGLPTVWFPLDRYPVGALWIMGGGLPVAVLTCLLVLTIGRFGPARGRFQRS